MPTSPHSAADEKAISAGGKRSPIEALISDPLSDARPRRVGDLAAELDVSQPTVSDAVATLDKRGLIARERDPADLRSTRIRLTDEGTAVAAAISTEIGPVLSAETGTSPERATTLRVLLGEIARLQQAGVITVNRSCLACRHYQPPTSRTRPVPAARLGTAQSRPARPLR
ncbi:MAG: MarR family winged helix-turn-helix transcriptional regulator [Acidimicrobiia bacterium]